MPDILTQFSANTDHAQAVAMSAYMRDQFPFLGIPKPKRALLSKEFLKNAKKAGVPSWDFIFKCWELPEREYQYLALDYLAVTKGGLGPSDLPKLKQLAVTKSWWDTVDSLDFIIGELVLKHPELNTVMVAWSTDENFWLRRIAIDHQLARKEKTDTALLAKIIENNFGQSEFFINKAIGWSLREYSKTAPAWVRAFIERHRDKLAPLSIREGSKYI
jgi:3-methyladenine DNA glycosylase AlkD